MKKSDEAKFLHRPIFHWEEAFSNIAFYQPHKFFNPLSQPAQNWEATFTNSTFTRLAVIELLPAADDVFADLVLSFNPGLGGEVIHPIF